MTLQCLSYSLRRAKLAVRLLECQFFLETVQFLGFEIPKGGIRPGSKKLAAAEEFATPKKVHEVRRFFGLTSFLRRFVRNDTAVVSPLTASKKKKTSFASTEE